MTKFKKLIKNLLGKKIFSKISPIWHGMRGIIASVWFGRSAQKMNLIGITGTKGKTSTAILTARLLNKLGHKTGFLSTALTFDGQTEIQNPTHMSTIDPWKLQEFLQKCHQNGCQSMILELSSQGLEQNRHWGIGSLKIATFLNIYPEHLQAHGSWENYRRAKSKIFKLLQKGSTAIVNWETKMQKNSQFMLQNAGKLKQIQNSEITKILINQEIWQIKIDDKNDQNNQINQSFYKSLLLDTNFLQSNSNNSHTKLQIPQTLQNEQNSTLNTKSNLHISLTNSPNSSNLTNNNAQKNEIPNSSLNQNQILEIPTNFVAEYEVKNLVYAIFICDNLIQSTDLQIDLVKNLQTIIPKIDINIPGRMDWVVQNNELK